VIVFRLAMIGRGLRRGGGFTAVMIAALALGIAAWYVEHQVYNFIGATPLAERGELLDVALQRPTPAARGVGDFLRELPAVLLATADARALLATGIPRRATATFGARALVQLGDRPAEQVRARYASRDLFAMFEIPIAQGEPWPAGDDAGSLAAGRPLAHVVIDAALAGRLFGATPAVGRRVRVEGFDVVVTGVVDERYQDELRLYDLFGAAEAPPAIYLPLASAGFTQAQPDFVRLSGRSADTFDDLRAGDHGWLQLWVELPGAAQRGAFLLHARQHLASAQDRGEAPQDVTLRSALAWRREIMVSALMVHSEAINLWPLLAGLALSASVVNLVRMFMARFGGRSQDLGVLRAFGARRRELAGQLLLEAAVIGLVAGVVGLVLGVAMMPIASAVVIRFEPFVALSLRDGALTIAVSTLAAVVAALYPAWRLGRGTPAEQLRRR